MSEERSGYNLEPRPLFDGERDGELRIHAHVVVVSVVGVPGVRVELSVDVGPGEVQPVRPDVFRTDDAAGQIVYDLGRLLSRVLREAELVGDGVEVGVGGVEDVSAVAGQIDYAIEQPGHVAVLNVRVHQPGRRSRRAGRWRPL